MLDRRYIGIEASPEYVREATRNIEEVERISASADKH
jgi:DNA modification methylase